MTWPALRRVLDAVPVRTLDELRPATDDRAVALRCTMRGCRACAEFAGEGERARYEAALRGVSHVVPWDCTDAGRRALAWRAGVDRLPAYVFLTRTGTRIECPTESS